MSMLWLHVLAARVREMRTLYWVLRLKGPRVDGDYIYLGDSGSPRLGRAEAKRFTSYKSAQQTLRTLRRVGRDCYVLVRVLRKAKGKPATMKDWDDAIKKAFDPAKFAADLNAYDPFAGFISKRKP
jgi:hypothetical protein